MYCLLFIDEFLSLLLWQLWNWVASYLMSMVMMMIMLNGMVMLVFMIEICCCISILRHSNHGSIQRVLIMHCWSHILFLHFMFNVRLIIYDVLRHCDTTILSIVVIHTLGLNGATLGMLHFDVILTAVIVGGVMVLLITH